MVLAINMNEKTNLKYKIPQPLKEVTRSIASCIYQSEFCQYSSLDIASAMVISAAENKSLEAIAKSPNSDTVFWRIYKGVTFEKLEQLVKTQKPPKGTHIKILIDGHDKMFHGKDTLALVGTKPKDGASKSFKYMAAFSTTQPKGMIAIREMFDGSVTKDAMDLVEELRKDYIIDVVVMDGEFYKAELVEYLSDRKIHFVVKRTNTGNIRALNVRYGKPYLYEQDVKRADGKVIHLKYWIYKYKGKAGDFFLVSDMEKNPNKIRKIFRTRWEIETGFREVNRVEIKTTTRDFLVRLFFYIISCIVYNLWQKIRFRYSMVTVKFDEVIEAVKRFVKEIILKPTDILGMRRRRYINLRI